MAGWHSRKPVLQTTLALFLHVILFMHPLCCVVVVVLAGDGDGRRREGRAVTLALASSSSHERARSLRGSVGPPSPPPPPARLLSLGAAAFPLNLTEFVFPPDRDHISCSVRPSVVVCCCCFSICSACSYMCMRCNRFRAFHQRFFRPRHVHAQLLLASRGTCRCSCFVLTHSYVRRLENDSIVMDGCDGRAYMHVNPEGFYTRYGTHFRSFVRSPVCHSCFLFFVGCSEQQRVHSVVTPIDGAEMVSCSSSLPFFITPTNDD